jgi:hypothetical protein
MNILVICHFGVSGLWEKELLSRLEELEYQVVLQNAGVAPTRSRLLDCLLWLESFRFGASLAGSVPSDCAHRSMSNAALHDLVIDLTGKANLQNKPVLTVDFSGHGDFAAGLTQMMTSGRSMEIFTRLDGVAVGQARPMLGDRLWLSQAADDMLAGAVTLIVQSVERFQSGWLRPIDLVAGDASPGAGFLPAYLRFVFEAIVGRIHKKVRLGRRPFYWQVAYRQIDGPAIAEHGQLAGPAFTVLADDGKRFYADPFALEHQGRHFLFVEEFPYERGKGIISVAELIDGEFTTPRAVLMEPHHLSYPQVLALDGDVFMIPESSAAREVILYRAEQFPDVWVRDTVLLPSIDFNDATLLERNGRLWLFGTQRFGRGSASDTMTVYSATSIRGPWSPHARNPIMIDHSATRPGGAFIRHDGTLVLPVQNGSEAYGGGLGLMELIRLDDDEVIFAPPRPVRPGHAWARKGIHTLNRSGKLEVVDSAG